MTENEFDDLNSENLEVEVLEQNQLQVLVKDLEPNKANFFIEKFADHVKMAAEWAKKAKFIIVTDENQTVLMKQAKVARLFLREKRLEIENTRKVLKADALKEGQAIDKISNFLKDLITPTELHLERQEKFVEFREAAKAEAIRLEVEKKMEEDRIAKEKKDAEELILVRAENERLRELAIVKAEEEMKFRKEKEKEFEEEREKSMRIQNELILRERAEKQKEADKIRAEEKLKSASDVDKMYKLRDDLMAIKFPEVTSQEAKLIIGNGKNNLGLILLSVNRYIEVNGVQQEE